MSMLSPEELERLSPAESLFPSPIPVLGHADGKVKTAIFGGNNARLYNFRPQQRAELENDKLAGYKALYEKHGAGRTNLAYGYALRAPA
jgi:hypothetical protein